MSACKGTSGNRCQSIFDLIHPNQPSHDSERVTLTTIPRVSALLNFHEEDVGSLTSCTTVLINREDRETGPTVYSPYPRRLEKSIVTICGTV